MAEGPTTPIERLPEYHAVDPAVPIGYIPAMQCVELQATAAKQELGPGGRYDFGWVNLETSIAMSIPGVIDPATGTLFASKQKSGAKEQAKKAFRAVAQDERAAVGLRARAIMAGASIDMQHDMIRTRPHSNVKSPHIPYLQKMQTAARLLLGETDRTDDDEALLRAMTSAIVMGECSMEAGWVLPAPPRQPWSLNAVLRASNRWLHVVVGEEAPPDTDILALPLDALGNDVWGEEDAPHTTLRHYLELPAGFFARSRYFKERKLFDRVVGRHIDYLSEHTPTQLFSPPKFSGEVVDAPATETSESTTKRVEIAWYEAQSARDFRDVDRTTLHVNILNLEEAYARESLGHLERHTLGWMQMDYAYAATLQVKAKRVEAEQARIQASRVSQYDARSKLAAADAAEKSAEKLMTEAKERYDTAINTLNTVADAIMATRPGEAYDIRLDAEAGYVYKALFTGASAEELEEVINTYTHRLGAFYMPMRAIEKKLESSRNPKDLEQLDVLHTAGVKAALCLLVRAASDEAARNLALPASLRGGGMQGQMDAIAFPAQYDDNTDSMTYAAETPINIQMLNEQRITHERHYVGVSLNLFMPHGDPLGRLAKLVGLASTRKSGPLRAPTTSRTRSTHKKGKKGRNSKNTQARQASIDELGLMLSDAIADAQED